ncbi:ATP-binding protein [Streptomyces rectiviolaceus]|uniref:Histidine kinase/HSP90-like ATPase domain-containing protein n=1 Tax=Streptomyces rectiviolaceus TaxID=332591 RepID=A0ABP6MC75_9ACTN
MSATPGPREVPPVTLLESRFTRDDLPRLRMLVEQYADHQGLTEPRRGEFIVAVDAVAVNAVEHAGGGGTLVLQRGNGHLACHIHDLGPGFSADVIPALAPGLDGHAGGRGLWLAGLLTDELTISAGPGGTRVTLAVRLPR